MKVDLLSSFLSKLSLMVRRFYLDIRLSYDFSDTDDVAQVTISKVQRGSGSALTPSAIFSISDTSVRFLKIDFTANVDFIEYEVSSFFELRMVVLYVIFLMVSVEHPDHTFFDYLSKMFSAKIETARDLLRYMLTTNEIEFTDDGEYLYVYDYGNFTFYGDAISFFSTQSVRVVYKVDSDYSIFSVVGLIFDSIYAASFPDEEIGHAKVFQDEDLEEPPAFGADEEDGDGLGGGGFGGMGGDGFGGGDDFGGGEGSGANKIPTEGGDEGFGGGGGFESDTGFGE